MYNRLPFGNIRENSFFEFNQIDQYGFRPNLGSFNESLR